MFQIKKVSSTLPDGKAITIETGQLARQADGSVLLRCGDAALLATVVANKEPRPGQSFFPLSVDYQEKFASAGRIPGSFHKREGRLNDYEILISRLVDRALRPLFPDDYMCDVQVMISLLSADAEVMPDALAGFAASAALAVSNIPIQEMISEVRVARINGAYVANPSRSALATADMDFIVAGTAKNILMVEGESKECSEEDLVTVIATAHEEIKKQIAAQQELCNLVGNPTKREYTKPYRNEELKAKIETLASAKILEVAQGALGKHERTAAFKTIAAETKEHLGELSEEDASLVGYYFHDIEKDVIRNMMLDSRVRLDGRKLDVVRPLEMEISFLPGPHGCALFTRGETQSITTTTFGTPKDEQLIETAGESNYSKFLLHYNFPPFSTGEVKMLRGASRREVGHGNLAMRSLKQMMPTHQVDYPYTIRVVSDVLESNGSSSMATVCAGSLSLMDAGVPLPKHISGVAMGLVTRNDGKYAILTDILGDEDHLGDMDFKVTGTRDGICGVQMDIKIDGLSKEVLTEALMQAKQGRMHILDAMYECIPAHRAEPKPHAPRVEVIKIDKEFIGAIIGPGGKVIQEMQRETGATIDIEEIDNFGLIRIFCNNAEGLNAARKRVEGIIAVPEIGQTYDSVVKSIQPYGAFVEFMPGKQGLLHISEISWARLEKTEDALSEGQEIQVKLLEVDPKTGKYRLSMKALVPKPERQA